MITLRVAGENDLLVIARIATKTYGPTYTAIIGQEQVDYMLGQFYTLAALKEQCLLGHVFLIAQYQGKDVAFASYSVTDPENAIYKLHKLYVLPEAHGQGLGRVLINEVRSKAIASGAKALELNVNRHNQAKAFYEKAGFKIKETVDIEIGNGFQMNDYVMSLSLG